MQMAILGMLAAILVVQHSASVLPLAACALAVGFAADPQPFQERAADEAVLGDQLSQPGPPLAFAGAHGGPGDSGLPI